MPLEDRAEFIDQVAQTVLDRIEERERLSGLVDQVARRVLELQKEREEAKAILAAAPPIPADPAPGHTH